MPATGRDRLSRRALLFGCVAAAARGADPAQEVWELIDGMAVALGTGDPGEFLAAFDPAMPGYADLRTNVTALIAQADVESAVDPVSNTGDDRARALEVDWQLQLVDRSGLNRVTRRREAVKCKIEKRGRKWKIVSMDPAGFFAPPSA